MTALDCFWCDFSGFGLTGDASNRSVFTLIPKLTQDNKNKIKTIGK